MEDFPANQYQRVFLNRQVSRWAAIKPGVPQSSMLGTLLFLIYVNNLSTGLSSGPSSFVNDTSLFSVARDMTSSTNVLI